MNKVGTQKIETQRMLMDKAGLRQEGILRAAGKNNLGICDEVWHAIIREDRFVNFELQDTEWLFETKDHE